MIKADQKSAGRVTNQNLNPRGLNQSGKEDFLTDGESIDAFPESPSEAVVACALTVPLRPDLA